MASFKESMCDIPNENEKSVGLVNSIPTSCGKMKPTHVNHIKQYLRINDTTML